MTTNVALQPDAQSSGLWRAPNYVTWFLSDTARELSNALVYFAVPLVALVVTGDPAQAGIIAAVGSAVGIVLTLFGGVIADERRRTTLMLVGALLGIVLLGAFALLDLAGALTFTILLVLNAALRARGGIFDTAGEALLKDIVPADAMGRAQAANQGRGAALQLIGGPLGGFLLGIGGWLVGLVALIFQAIAAVTAFVLGRSLPAASPDAAPAVAGEAEPFGERLKSGIAWSFARRDLRGVVVAATIINLGMTTSLTTIVYAMQQSGVPIASIGWIGAVSGASMLVGAVIAPALIVRIRAGVLIVAGLAVLAGAIIALASVSSLAGVLMVLGATSVVVPVVNSALIGYFMVAVPSEMMGRASSAMQVLSMAALPFAPIVAGFGLAHVGRTPTLIFAAALCVIAALVALTNRGIRSLPIEAKWAVHADTFAVKLAGVD